MTRTITLKEAQTAYSTVVEQVQSTGEPLIVEQDGKPTVVVVPFVEYRQLVAQREREQESVQHAADAAWCQEQLFARRVERETFQRLLPDLLKSHAGKFVAIQGNRVVDSDPDESALAQRTREQGYRPVFIEQVTQTPTIVEFSSPEDIHGAL